MILNGKKLHWINFWDQQLQLLIQMESQNFIIGRKFTAFVALTSWSCLKRDWVHSSSTPKSSFYLWTIFLSGPLKEWLVCLYADMLVWSIKFFLCNLWPLLKLERKREMCLTPIFVFWPSCIFLFFYFCIFVFLYFCIFVFSYFRIFVFLYFCIL